MNQLYMVKVKRTVITEELVVVSAPDRHQAADAAYDFARANDLADRRVLSGTELSAYASDAFEVQKADVVDVTV